MHSSVVRHDVDVRHAVPGRVIVGQGGCVIVPGVGEMIEMLIIVGVGVGVGVGLIVVEQGSW